MNTLEQFLVPTENHQEEILAGRNAAQYDLALEKKMELARWQELYADRFAQIVKDNPSILENLSKTITYNETLDLISSKLYSSNTIH